MSDRKRKPRQRRRARQRNAKYDNDKQVTTTGHHVTITGNGSFTILEKLLGSIASELIEPLLNLFTGDGDYRGEKMKKNSLVLQGNPPKLSSNGELGVNRFQHREFVGYVFGSTNFSLTSYILQPGQSSVFPWLSQIAVAYQEYEILGMVVAYYATSGNATGSNTSLGEVILATNYNSAAPNFANAPQMLNSEFATRGTPAANFLHMIECAPHQNPISELFVRGGAIPAGQDQRLYDFANLQVATQGNPTANQQLGEIWITYDIQFYKPILGGVVSGFDIPSDHFQLTTVAGGTPLGTSQKQAILGGIGGTINGATGTTYTFPSSVTEGIFLFLYLAQGTAANTTSPIMVTPSANTWTYVQCLSSNAGPDQNSILNSTNGVMNATFFMAFVMKVTATPVVPLVVQWGVAGTLPTAPCYGDLFVTQLNSNLNGFFDKVGNEFLMRSLQEIVTREVEKCLEEKEDFCFRDTLGVSR